MSADDGSFDEATRGVTQLALITAGRVGEDMARLRESMARAAEARSEREHRELRERFEAERNAARAALAPVEQSQWWDVARPEEVERAWQTAHAWRAADPEAARAEARIRYEVRERYGIALDPAEPDLQLDRDRRSPERDSADAAREEARERARRDVADTELLMRAATAAEQAAEGEVDRANDRRAEVAGEEAEVRAETGAGVDHSSKSEAAEVATDRAEQSYDSTVSREHRAEQWRAAATEQVAEARIRADLAQAKPATEAVGGAVRAAGRPARGARAAAQAARSPEKGLGRGR